MHTSRREFVQSSAAAGAAFGFGWFPHFAGDDREIGRAEESLRILILGGTGFIGPYQVRYALERGHEVTLFNRGKTNPHLFPDIEKLRGDRDGDLRALEGREWDAVIDNSATIPRWVRDSAGLLADSVRQYLYISSTGVYLPYLTLDIDETAPTSTIDDPTIEVVDGDTYGALKALSEQEVQRALPNGATIVRPHLIVGPGDPTDRFTYWPVRIDRGGEVMAPGEPTDAVQFIDVRDLTEFCIHLLEAGTTGVYNAAGPEARLSIAEMLYGIRAITSEEVAFTWLNADFLAEHDVHAWSEMTVWIAPRGDYRGMTSINRARAIANGLTYRPLAVTAKDTLDWWKALPEDRRAEPRAGLAAERESEVLAAWHSASHQEQTHDH